MTSEAVVVLFIYFSLLVSHFSGEVIKGVGDGGILAAGHGGRASRACGAHLRSPARANSGAIPLKLSAIERF